jgi:hypothetical protein
MLSRGILNGDEYPWRSAREMKNWLMTVIGSVGSAVALVLAASAFPMMWVRPVNVIWRIAFYLALASGLVLLWAVILGYRANSARRVNVSLGVLAVFGVSWFFYIMLLNRMP